MVGLWSKSYNILEMPEFVISGYRYGLDTRKDVLTSQPGTLVTCENAHINTGGELEKRKSFELYKDVLILDDFGNSDVGTFGIENTDAGLVVFGSAYAFGASSPFGAPNLQSALPTGITYQQLLHPALGIFGDDYDRTIHRITAIPFSENFNGKAFAAATFADGNTFLYYDGAIVEHSQNGLVFSALTDLATLATALQRQLVNIGWVPPSGDATADSVDELGVVQNGSYLVKSPQADYFTPIVDETSALGRIGVKNIDQDGIGTQGTKAVAGFKVNALTVTPGAANYNGGGTVAYTGLVIGATYTWTKGVNDTSFSSGTTILAATGSFVADATTGNGQGTPAAAVTATLVSNAHYKLEAPESAEVGAALAELCGGTIILVDTATNIAAFIARSVNDLTSVHSYTAISKDDSVFVYAPASFGNVTFNLTVTGAVSAAGPPPTDLSGVITPSPLNVTLALAKNRTTTVKGDAKIDASGGTGPYTFLWEEATLGSGNGIIITQFAANESKANNATASFSKSLVPNTTVKGNFKCTITPFSGPTLIVYLTVSLTATFKSGQ